MRLKPRTKAPRKEQLIDLDEFRAFVSEKVTGVRLFQFGCVMEPTLDKRLCDFMAAVAASPAAPSHEFRLQTNGILLHRHDVARMLAAGLTLLTISVDSVTGDTHKSLRGSISLSKVQRNIIAFRKACPGVKICLLTTVTADNIDEVDELIIWGQGEGVNEYRFRQMFHHWNSRIVDHDEMSRLEVTAEAFAAMRARVENRFGVDAELTFLSNDFLVREGRETRQNSLIPVDN
jgi:molybdenum cofactor biosynthesis enzyme MoaA